jgi:uncharacterized membrane protein YgaE (UPF0421/DUF939 family)
VLGPSTVPRVVRSSSARPQAAQLRRLRGRLDPERVVDLVQTVKTAFAGGLAWWLATDIGQLDQAFLAPWAAVLVVHATVYKTVSRASQQVAATFFAVFLAFAAGSLLGIGPWSLGVVILIGFLVGQLRWVKDEAATIATTALVTLATGTSTQMDLLASRLIDTAVGVGVGLAVNLLVWPPLRDRVAWSHALKLSGELSEVLRAMAVGAGDGLTTEETDGWVRQLRTVDLRIDQAWRLLWQARESGRFNPRRSRPTGWLELRELLHQLEQAVADSLSMARTMRRSVEEATPWDESFRERWCHIAHRTADLADAHDLPGLEALGEELEQLARDFSEAQLLPREWREYGGLVMNLRNVHDAFTRATQSALEATPDRRRSSRYDVPGDLLRRRRGTET